MTDEDRLRQRLQDQVAGTHVMADLDDVAVRIGARAHRRDRPLILMALAALVIGTVGGFAGGRVTRGTTQSVTVAGEGNAAEQPGPTSTAPSAAQASGEQQWSRLFVRTTADGIAMRVFLDPNASPADVYVEVSTGDAVAFAARPETATTAGPISSTGGGSFGTHEGAPARWVIVHVGHDVARVRARFGNDRDEMEPVQGIAVLAHPGTAPVVVDALDGQGKTLASRSVTNDLCTPLCSPTPTTLPPGAPTLPAPGSEQPADPAAARQDVTQSVAAAFEGSRSDQSMADAIQGGDALAAVFDELRTGSFAREVTEARTVVDGIVFRSASSAAVKFHSDLGPDGTSGPYFADAALTAGGWQITRASYCQIIIAAGAHCP